jgi:hypothetical protein
LAGIYYTNRDLYVVNGKFEVQHVWPYAYATPTSVKVEVGKDLALPIVVVGSRSFERFIPF